MTEYQKRGFMFNSVGTNLIVGYDIAECYLNIFEDGGSSWEELIEIGKHRWYMAVVTLDDNFIYAAAIVPERIFIKIDTKTKTYTRLIKEDDQLLWRSMSVNETGNVIVGVSDKNFVCVSIDGGDTWAEHKVTDETLRGIQLSVTGKYMVVSDTHGSIYSSVDMGLTWTKNFNRLDCPYICRTAKDSEFLIMDIDGIENKIDLS